MYESEVDFITNSQGFIHKITFGLTNFASTGDNGAENMLTDRAFNGKKYNWLLQGNYTSIAPGAGDTLVVRLKPLTKERYLYNKSLSLYYGAKDNPFSEPTLLYTNIQKGYGMFTISGNYAEKKIVF